MGKKLTYEKLEQKVRSLEKDFETFKQAQTSLQKEHHETEEKLRNSEKRSRTWLEYSPVCTKIVDLDFNLQYMSSAGIIGLKIEDVTSLYG